ncbi:hypothetical protein [Sinorhizobium meliloti]|uniref:hypothetical protein n=1 Tax=Rhizobium meliloti TaxID=382 RepID=UPI001F323042|nr:hypothetical protein [Sinorhizobium meliloti]
MSEAELHVIKARLRGGILNKVRRGEFRCLLPTGLVYDHFGNVTLDPDMQVRETIIHFFEMFSRLGSASQTVKIFRNQGLLFPSRLHNGDTLFRPLTASTGDACPQQSALRWRLHLWPTTVSTQHRWQEDFACARH